MANQRCDTDLEAVEMLIRNSLHITITREKQWILSQAIAESNPGSNAKGHVSCHRGANSLPTLTKSYSRGWSTPTFMHKVVGGSI